MVYTPHPRRRSRRPVKSHRRTRARNATARVAKRSRYRRSARAQSGQIRTVAKAVLRVQKQLRDDQNSVSRWQTRIENHELDADVGSGIDNNKGIFVFPLTSGPGQAANAAVSSMDDPNSTAIRLFAWDNVQPMVRDTESGQTNKLGPAWIKLYTQTVRMCFYANTMNRGNKFHMAVIRLARDSETQSDNTILQRQTSIDGAALNGNPGVGTRFNLNEDFYGVHGFRDPTPTDSGATDLNGYELIRINGERYKVVHQRQFALGRYVGPIAGTAVATQPAGSLTQHARDYYETSFKINYGGAKLMAIDDDPLTSAEPITLSDVDYKNLDPKLKHWLVIWPQRKCSTSAGTGMPRFSLCSNVTCKVPT